MPQPTPGDVHVDRLLTNVSIAYLQAETSFIAGRVFPQLPVNFKSDKIAIFDKQPWMRSQARPRALASESAGGGYTVSTTTYTCEVYGIHKDVDDQVRANSDQPFTPDRNATQWVTQQLLLQREIQWMSDFFAASKWTTEWAGSGSASDYTAGTVLYWDNTNATPIADVINAGTAVQELIGMRPNVLVIQRKVYDKLKTCADIEDRIKYTSAASIDLAMLARLFEVEEVMIAEAVYDSAAEGAAASQSFIAGTHALLAYRTRTPSLETPSAGYIPTWTGYLGAGAFGNRIKKFRQEQLNSDRVEGELAYDMLITCADAGLFFNDLLT